MLTDVGFFCGIQVKYIRNKLLSDIQQTTEV